MRRFLNIDEEIFLNQFSQGLVSLEKMNSWFEKYDIINRKDIIHNLLNMMIQSHPTYEEIESAAKSIKKVTSSAATKLLNRNKPFNKFGYELCDLPEKELLNCFDIMLLTFSISDNRRKSQEDPNNCNHWWHKDLSDERYLEQLRKSK